ncbi:MAG: phosphoribosyltransferase [Acetobacteraceae bacterium]
MTKTGFRDRRDAGRRLAAALHQRGLVEPAVIGPPVIGPVLIGPVVIGLPRGGVPVAAEVAAALGAPLDILLVRKIGAPGQPEFGLGAVADGPEPLVVLDDDLMATLALPPGYIEAEIGRQIEELRARRTRFAGARRPVPIGRRTVIVVDDGLATGGTVRAALRALRRQGAQRLILAVPVAAPESLHALRHEFDDVVCVLTPERMRAVGHYYEDFAPTPEQDVIALLQAEARRRDHLLVPGGSE